MKLDQILYMKLDSLSLTAWLTCNAFVTEMESNGLHEFSTGPDRYKMKLEDQILEMKRTIEDLKQKVVEQREELWKEKHENDKMIREQEVFRKQLVSTETYTHTS
jgi:TolA-binding protein